MEVLGYSALNGVEIRNRIMLNFYPRLPHILTAIQIPYVLRYGNLMRELPVAYGNFLSACSK